MSTVDVCACRPAAHDSFEQDCVVAEECAACNGTGKELPLFETFIGSLAGPELPTYDQAIAEGWCTVVNTCGVCKGEGYAE